MVVTKVNWLHQNAQEWIVHSTGYNKGNSNDRVRHSVDDGANGHNKVCEWATSPVHWWRVLSADLQESGKARKESGAGKNSLGSLQIEVGIYCYTNLRNGYDIHEIKLLNDIYILWTLSKAKQVLCDLTRTSTVPSIRSSSKPTVRTLILPSKIPFSPPSNH